MAAGGIRQLEGATRKSCLRVSLELLDTPRQEARKVHVIRMQQGDKVAAGFREATVEIARLPAALLKATISNSWTRISPTDVGGQVRGGVVADDELERCEVLP